MGLFDYLKTPKDLVSATWSLGVFISDFSLFRSACAKQINQSLCGRASEVTLSQFY